MKAADLRTSLLIAACAALGAASCGGSAASSADGSSDTPGGENVEAGEASCGGAVCAAELEDPEESEEPSP